MAEEPLGAYSSCLLGSLNLSEFVQQPFTKDAHIDYAQLKQAVIIAINALNDVLIEGEKLHPLKEQQQAVHDWRQIGLGIMGLGDMFIKMGETYGSDYSLILTRDVMSAIAQTAVIQSLNLAKLKGCYPACNKQALFESTFLNNIQLPPDILNEIKQYGLYNSQLLTCAPTGSIGTMFGCSTGVEPNFAFEFNRRTVSLNKEETVYKVYPNIVKQYTALYPTEKLPNYFIASQQIDPMNRLAIQSVLQSFIDASISSTINLPETATIDDVFNIYMKAWECGLKGVTIYRDNCQRQGILTTKDSKQSENSEIARGYIVKADDSCIGLKRTLTTGCGTLHCTAYFDTNTGELRETYLSKGSTGGCNNFMIGLSRMISLAARGGVKLPDILDQLKSCGTCPSYAVRTATQHDTSKGSCCPVAVGNALKDMYDEIQTKIKNNELKVTVSAKPIIATETTEATNLKAECPNCHHNTLIHTGGCVECTDCGWSRCG